MKCSKCSKLVYHEFLGEQTYRFEEDESHQPLSFTHNIGLVFVVSVTRSEIGAPSQ